MLKATLLTLLSLTIVVGVISYAKGRKGEIRKVSGKRVSKGPEFSEYLTENKLEVYKVEIDGKTCVVSVAKSNRYDGGGIGTSVFCF